MDGVHGKQWVDFMAACSVGLTLQIQGMQTLGYMTVLAARESV